MLLLCLPREALCGVLAFLTERDRVRLLVTNKTLSHWLLERREAAAAAFEGMKSQGSLYFCNKFKLPRGTRTQKIRVTLGEDHLIHIWYEEYFIAWTGQMFNYDDVLVRFSPWAHAEIRNNEEEKRPDASDDGVINRLLLVSKRLL